MLVISDKISNVAFSLISKHAATSLVMEDISKESNSSLSSVEVSLDLIDVSICKK